MKILASGLQFPEGPVAMPDGSVILVEIARETLSRINARRPRRKWSPIFAGDRMGLLSGPGGKMYVCNNGGFAWIKERGTHPPLPAEPKLCRVAVSRSSI